MVDHIEQNTPEWFAARLGKVTASKMSAVMSKGRGSAPSATRATYMGELVAERLSGVANEGFSNSTMDHGTETEPQARAAYTMATGRLVTQVGFINHPSIKDSGASPDGEVPDNGLIEIKCPLTKTHIETLKSAEAPSQYIKQMQWQMACTGRSWCDFVSFDPRMPDNMRLKVIRVVRDEVAIREMEAETINFLVELRSEVKNLVSLYGEPE